MNPKDAAGQPATPALWKRVAASALAWYLVLVMSGSVLLSIGVAIQWGIGYGAIAIGTLMITGAEVVRSGIRHA